MQSPGHAVVLGGAGFIGRHVCRELAARKWRVTAIGHGAWTEAEWSSYGVSRWLSRDITVESVDQSFKDGEWPDLVIHCAGSGSVGFSYASPLEDFQRTVSTVASLLDAARPGEVHPAPRIVLASSAAVYGDQGDVDLSESAPRSPVSPYGFHKAAAESICDSYCRFFGSRVSVVRLFSVYGEGLRKQLLWDAMNKFGRGGFEFFGTGHELRDWIHVDDAAKLLVAAGTAEQASFEIYNGGHDKVTIRAILEQLASAAGYAAPVLFNGQTHTGNPRRLTADCGHAHRQLLWLPTISLQEGLKRYVDWYRDTEHQ